LPPPPVRELEDALRLDSSEFEAKHGFPKPQQGDEIITHCNKGGRAGKATEALNARGYHNVKTYKGSFNDWVAQGGEIDKHDH
ncbi:thiosulfate:glutathione sulfurtransferase, partial [Hyalella azteca]|uniref:Thiosulfate:glutathione sulfurtransferase n=1 Tax=Hyalella azteca TaxID=294128 RepID=A0A8B7N0W0_HYAAZ